MKKKFTYKILDLISTIACFSLAFSSIFLIQYWTIGLIPPLNEVVLFNKFYLKELLFVFTSIYIVSKYVGVSTPYRKYLSKH